MKSILILLAAVAILSGCEQGLEPGPRAPVLVGEKESGQSGYRLPVYRFRLTRSNAIGVTRVSNKSIRQRAIQICPDGYSELGRSGEITRRISGVIYSDVDVTILCD